MTAATAARPVVPGYVRAHLLMTEHELADLKDDLERFAEKCGYVLGRVFVERIDRVPAAFGALLEVIEQDQPEAVVVPSALHLAVLGLPPQIQHHLQAVTGARIIFANAPELPPELASTPHTLAETAT